MLTRWQLLKEFIRQMWKMSLTFLAALILFAGAVWWAFARAGSPLPFLLAAAVIWLAANLALYIYVMRTYRKQLPLAEIQAEKGPCDELLQKHCELYPNPAQDELLRRVDLLLVMERWDEAEALLNTVSEADVKPPNIVVYYNCLLLLLLETGRDSLAYKIFCDNRGMIEGYIGHMHGQSAKAAFFGTAMTLLAMQGDAAGSAQYLSMAEITYPKNDSLPPFIPRILRAERLYLLGERAEADALAAELRSEIAESPALKKEWRKQQLLHMLDHAAARQQTAQRSFNT